MKTVLVPFTAVCCEACGGTSEPKKDEESAKMAARNARWSVVRGRTMCARCRFGESVTIEQGPISPAIER